MTLVPSVLKTQGSYLDTKPFFFAESFADFSQSFQADSGIVSEHQEIAFFHITDRTTG
jgi:hypothetical protein